MQTKGPFQKKKKGEKKGKKHFRSSIKQLISTLAHGYVATAASLEDFVRAVLSLSVNNADRRGLCGTAIAGNLVDTLLSGMLQHCSTCERLVRTRKKILWNTIRENVKNLCGDVVLPTDQSQGE